METIERVDAERATIVGVATGTPDGGVAIIRVSGPRVREIVSQLGVELDALPERRLLLRVLRAEPELSGEEALVAWMPGPRSFTGEDVVELHVHSGRRNVGMLVDQLQRAGARAATAGEFTRRAFEQGKLTLERAEGIAAIIGAQTEEALNQARRLVAGELGREVTAKADAVGELRAEIEANLDFPEDVDPGDVRRWTDELSRVRDDVRRWLRGFEAGRRAREQARFVIAGPVNAGKSTLFNALLGRPRAIVADAPGTTRDYVEAELEFGPHAATLVDTAGLRSEPEPIEAQGIVATRDQMEGADLIIWVQPSTQSFDDPEPVGTGSVLRVETMRDLGRRRPRWIGVNPATGVESLRAELQRWFTRDRDSAWIGLARHREAAASTLEHLDRAYELLVEDVGLEMVAFELGAGQRRLDSITGRTALGPVGEDLLRRIFERFCIGK